MFRPVGIKEDPMNDPNATTDGLAETVAKAGDPVLYEGQRRIVAEVIFGKVGGPHYRLRGCPFLVAHGQCSQSEGTNE